MENGLFQVYSVSLGDSAIDRRHVGSFLVEDGVFHIVEDGAGLIEGLVPDGQPLDEEGVRRIEHLKNSMYLDVVNQSDIDQGNRKDLLPQFNIRGGSSAPTMATPSAPKAPAVFEYQDQRMTQPANLRYDRGAMYLNDKVLGNDESKAVVEAIKQGRATLKYPKDQPTEAIAKAEAAMDSLIKAELKPSQHPSAKNYSKHDGIRSFYSFKNDESPPGSIHMHIHFHSPVESPRVHRDGATKAVATVLAKAGKGKKYHIGRERFHVLHGNPQEAFEFARKLTDDLRALPPVAGTHNHFASIGIGHDPDTAKRSQELADSARVLAGYPSGQGKTHVHSLLFGMEGHVPVGEDVLPLPPKV